MRFKRLVGIAIAGSMLASSTGALASPQVSPWATLTVLSGGAPAAAVCGAAATAAAQPAGGCVLPVVDTPPPVANAGPPPPPPPVGAVAAGYGVTPLLLGLVAIAGAVAFLVAVNNNNGHKQANSPG
jgi:hypothetical protein